MVAESLSDIGRIAIVILNWNCLEDTTRCVELMLAQDYSSFRIVVVDNGSRDGSVEQLRRWAEARNLVVVKYDRIEAEAGGRKSEEDSLKEMAGSEGFVVIGNETNLGFAAGNNVGIRYALAGGFGAVLVLNNDVSAECDCISRLAATLGARPSWAGVSPKIVDADTGRILYAGGRLVLWQARAVHLGRNRPDGLRWRGVRETAHITAGCALYRSRFLVEEGIFDEEFFFGHEDSALSAVARRSGWRLGVDLDCVVRHREGSSLAGRPEVSVYYFNKYRLVLVRKYAGRWTIFVALAFLALTRPPKLAARLLSGRRRLAGAEVRALWDGLRGRLAEFDRCRAAGEST